MNNSHADQPRSRGKFSFKNSPESDSVRLRRDGTMEPFRPALDQLSQSYYAGLAKGSEQDQARAKVTLGLLSDAAENSSTDKEASQYLNGRLMEAANDAYIAKEQKVGLLNVPGRIRRRREVRDSSARLDDARWAAGMLRNTMNIMDAHRRTR